MKRPASKDQNLVPASRLVQRKTASADEPELLQDGSPAGETGSEPGAELLEPAPRAYKKPMVVKAVDVAPGSGRRKFIVASMVAVAEGCDSAMSIQTENGYCTCHAVCSCDTDNANTGNESVRREERNGDGVCTCNTVCSCDSVCTCNSVCSCESVGGGSYWY